MSRKQACAGCSRHGDHLCTVSSKSLKEGVIGACSETGGECMSKEESGVK